MFLSNGRASPVRIVTLARAVLVMVTILSRMANVRTSSFTVRIPVWNRSELTLRSVGLSGILLPVLCEQGWSVAYQCVRRVHLLLLRGVLGVVHSGHSGCSLESCAYGRVLALLVFPFMSTVLGLWRCAYRWTRPSGGGRWGPSLRDSRGAFWVTHKCDQFFQVIGVIPWIWCFICLP